MFLRVVFYITISLTLAGVLLGSAALGVAQDHATPPALTGPANSSDQSFQAAEAELSEDLTEAGDIAVKEGDIAIEHPLGEKHAATATGEHGHGGHAVHKVNDDPLEWRADTALWTGVVFLIVFVLLYIFAWGPICEGLDKREKGIADNIEAAKKSNAEAKELLEEYQARLDATEDEVRSMINQARIDAEHTGKKIVEAAQTAADEEHQRALAEIEQATIGALSELAAKSADLAVSLAGKIVRSELKASDHATLVSEAVSNFGKPR